MPGAKDTKRSSVEPAICEIALTADELLRALLCLPAHRRLSILDSCNAHETSARFLIAGFDPFEIIEARGSQLSITRRGEGGEQVRSGDALKALDERLARYSVQPHAQVDLPAAGACIATFSYELGYQLERLRLSAGRASSDEPDVVLAFYDTLVIHDYARGMTRVVSIEGQERLEETTGALMTALKAGGEFESGVASIRKITSSFTREEYLAAVGRIKEHIAAGDIYQANLTQQFLCELAPRSRPENIFLRLRRDHPTPFAAFIRRREDVVVSASPERFLRAGWLGGERFIEACPIKGTRPRGATPAEDRNLRSELLMSEKDRAENIMIVDLLRNDLGRVCHYGSIEVRELCSLQELRTLFHLVSKVRGRLRADVTASALLRATFPCGSITGAPKIRAMEIIAGVERVTRGLSMGAIGYFSFDGALDLSVAIRTMVVRAQVARFNVGGGVVADSSPPNEYDESLVKARALFSGLGATNSTDC